MNAFGVDHEVAKRMTIKERKRARNAAVTVAGGAALAHPVGRRVSAVRAVRNANLLQGHRAAGLAEDLAKVPSSAKSGLGQRKLYYGMRIKNPDVKRVRPTADRWSRTFAGVSRIKAADPDAPIRFRDVVMRPERARATADAKIIRNLTQAAPAQRRDLHRVTFHDGKGPKVSDSSPTSWSTDPGIVDSVRRYQHRRNVINSAVSRTPGAGKVVGRRVIQGEPTTVSLPAGSAKTLNLSAATPRFRQSEHIARVKVEKRGRTRDDGSMTNAFGIAHPNRSI